jgi:hypothetical protein
LYETDDRMSSVMLEVRPDSYLDAASGEHTAGIDAVVAAVATVMMSVLRT